VIAACIEFKKGAGLARAFLLRAIPATVLETGMALDQTTLCRRVVIDDRSRLPGRFFGRFATSATSELTRAQ
jgi:hypothetical protein